MRSVDLKRTLVAHSRYQHGQYSTWFQIGGVTTARARLTGSNVLPFDRLAQSPGSTDHRSTPAQHLFDLCIELFNVQRCKGSKTENVDGI